MNIALIDNYDSFTYNLARYFREVPGVSLTIFKNDQFSNEDILPFDKIVISPGPGIPTENGRIIELIQAYTGQKPIFGVCLGLQAIYESFGGRLINLQRVFHGVSSTVSIVDPDDPILKQINVSFQAGRYHSWVCDPAFLPDELRITAWDEDNEIMACRHFTHPTFGVQFHPESFLTPDGKKMIENFVRL